MDEIILTGLRNMEDTVMIMDSDNRVIYANHDMVSGQSISNRSSFIYNGKGYVMVTASFPRNREIEEIDELTGLLTKGAFKQSLINFKADKAVVVFCDIDNLKHFNTVYGHLETGLYEEVSASMTFGLADVVNNNIGGRFVRLMIF